MLADLINTWTTEPGKRKWAMTYLPLALSILLICFIAWQLASLFWVWQAPASVDAPDVQISTPNKKTQTPDYDLGLIKSANLFGKFVAVDSAPPPEPDTDDLAETQLQLNLHGTLLSNNSEQSRAVIEVNGKDTVFSIGDEIQNNVSLHSVMAYQVIINNRGEREILRLPRDEESGQSRSSVRTQPARTSQSSNRIAQKLRNDALKNPSSITDIMRLKKGQTSTGEKGFRIYPGKNRDKFRELGLKPGDFVTLINGMPVAEQNPFQVIQTLSNSSFINLSLQRNGQAMNLSFDLSQTQ